MTNVRASYFLTVAALFLLNPPRALASYETVNKYCNSRTPPEVKEFCIKALESDPRSATAKDNVDLLLISADVATETVNKTLDFLVKMGPDSKLKECVDAYHSVISNLQSIPEDMKYDPKLGSYDAHMAFEKMVDECGPSLQRNNVSDPNVLGRYKNDLPYVSLCNDISIAT